MEAGRGYKYKSLVGKRTFIYPSVVVSGYGSMQVQAAKSDTYFKPIDNSQYPSNMTILAKVYKGEDAVIDAEVGIFDGNDCRATILADADGYDRTDYYHPCWNVGR